jgi:hypothetical protein
MAPRSMFASIAIVLLVVAAFGGLSVGVPLLFAQLTSAPAVGVDGSLSLIPAVALVYGLLSVAGLIGMLLGRRWAAPLVVVSQGIVALALIAIYADMQEWSLLVVAVIAGGAAVSALADARLRA